MPQSHTPIFIFIHLFHNLFKIQQVKGAVTVQMMVRSDLASSGVAFTLDPDTGFRDVIVLTGSWGLGESVVGGKVWHIINLFISGYRMVASV